MTGTSQQTSEHANADHHEVSDVHNAKSVTEIRAALADLHQKEAAVTTQLDSLIAAQKDLQRELGRLDLFRANLSAAAAKTRAISSGTLSDAASTANRISSSVKRLDLEQERIKEALTAVEQVRELKSCILGVTGSMGGPQDWETAASYLSRASKLPDEVIDGEFAARVVPTAEVPDSPRVTLENASESLCGLFLREFDKAVKDNDGAKITRFFKLFPLIDRSDVGLDVYGRYVCQGVSARARTNLDAVTASGHSKDGFAYASTLTKLFEHIAQIVDSHGRLVEAHYGPGKMARVMERLQSEADRQGGIIIDTWSDERNIDRQLTDIKAYPYTFLVQSFQTAQRPGFQGTPRSGSPAPARNSEDEGVDMKEVDALLNEMTLMLSKWSLYTRFITNKCAPDQSEDSPEIPPFLLNSSLMKKVEDKLLTPFSAMTTFFFRRSVEKAFQLDEQPSDLSLTLKKPLNSNPPHISSAIEDIMYIVNKVLQQSLATSQTAVISSVVPTLSRVLNSDFLGLQQRKMRDEHYPRPVVQGGLPPESVIVAFIVLVNNVDVAKDYISQMVSSRTQNSSSSSSASPLSDLFPYPTDAFHVNTTLTTINTTFGEKCTTLLTDATNVLYNNVAKPRLRPILADTFRDIEYNLSPAELNQLITDLGHDEGDLHSFASEVRNRFAHGWDALMLPLKRLMTESTFNALLSVTATYLSKMLEKRLWTYAGRINSNGAQRLEHDVNEIVKCVVTGQRDAWALREQFLRCVQICTILNMDEEEWEELGQSGAEEIADQLKSEERTRARKMLTD